MAISNESLIEFILIFRLLYRTKVLSGLQFHGLEDPDGVKYSGTVVLLMQC